MREPANRYAWPCPGDLLPMDTTKYARFQQPGHRFTGDRRSQDRRHLDGADVVHAIVDDHSGLAYAEIHDDQKAATVVAFLERALAFYERHGISATRLMTDNAMQYRRSRDLQRLLAQHAIRHLNTALPATHQRQGRALPPKRWRANGHTDSSTAPTANAPPHCHTGSTTTTQRGHTAHSEADPRSAAFTTSVSRTASGRGSQGIASLRGRDRQVATPGRSARLPAPRERIEKKRRGLWLPRRSFASALRRDATPH
jgi:Integrase core domain